MSDEDDGIIPLARFMTAPREKKPERSHSTRRGIVHTPTAPSKYDPVMGKLTEEQVIQLRQIAHDKGYHNIEGAVNGAVKYMRDKLEWDVDALDPVNLWKNTKFILRVRKEWIQENQDPPHLRLYDGYDRH